MKRVLVNVYGTSRKFHKDRSPKTTREGGVVGTTRWM